MQVHKILGHGFSETSLQDALMLEGKMKEIPVEREKEIEN